MKKVIGTGLLGFSLGLLSVQGQTAGEIAYKEAQAAFKNEDFSKSIKILEAAVGIDSKNASLWLLLGKSYYLSGDLESAVKSLETTLTLAPNEKYAKTMLGKLVKAQGTDSQKLKLIRELIAKNYFNLADQEAQNLSKRVLVNDIKGELLFERARIAHGMGQTQTSVLFLETLKTDFPDFKALHKVRLLKAILNLSEKGRVKIEQALLELKELSTHKDKKIASDAELLLLRYRLSESVNSQKVLGLDKWLTANPEHASYLSVVRELISHNKVLLLKLPSGKILKDEEKKIFTLLQSYIDKNVLIPDRLSLGREVQAFISLRIKKNGPNRELIQVIEAFLSKISGAEESLALWGRYQLSLLTQLMAKEVSLKKKNGLFVAGVASDLTNKFVTLEALLLKEGLLKEKEAFVLLQEHLKRASSSVDFKLVELLIPQIKQVISKESALEIDLKVLMHKATYHGNVLLNAVLSGQAAPQELPVTIQKEFDRWHSLYSEMSSAQQAEGFKEWQKYFHRIFKNGLEEAVISCVKNQKNKDLSALRFFSYFTAELQHKIALKVLKNLKDPRSYKKLPEPILAAIDSYSSYLRQFGKGDSVNLATNSLVFLLNSIELKALTAHTAAQYKSLEALLVELNTTESLKIAQIAAFLHEQSLFKSVISEFNRTVKEKRPLTVTDEFKAVFASHADYLKRYPQSSSRQVLVYNFYHLSRELIAHEEWQEASKVIDLLIEKKINPTKSLQDNYLSLVIQSGGVLNDFTDSELLTLLPGHIALDEEPLTDDELVVETQAVNFIQIPALTILNSKEKIIRDKLFTKLIVGLQKIIDKKKENTLSGKAQRMILKIAAHWETHHEWKRAVVVYRQYLNANKTMLNNRGTVRQAVANALLQESKKIDRTQTWPQQVAKLAQNLKMLRDEYSSINKDVLVSIGVRRYSGWQSTLSYLEEARQVSSIKKSLSRSRYLRYARELTYFVKNNFLNSYTNQVPGYLKSLGNELMQKGFNKDAIEVYRQLSANYPGNSLSRQGGMLMAQIYKNKLKQPIKAAEVYLEMNYQVGGDLALQNEIFNMANQLKSEKRWIESLHILEVFTASFPRHQYAGRAMELIGEIHQANGAWEDAITAYAKVIEHCKNGIWVKEARWAIAECYIQLSNWSESLKAYRLYDGKYKKDSRKNELKWRVTILKDLSRYQVLVNEKGQRKSFDAQFQIATIVRDKLRLQKKAAAEFLQVYEKWPKAHLADDALYQRGVSLMNEGNVDEARKSWVLLAAKFEGSPLADDALFLVGKSYEDESLKLAQVDRGSVVTFNKARVQKEAYQSYYGGRAGNRKKQASKLNALLIDGNDQEADFQQAKNVNQQWQFDNAYVANTLLSAERQVAAYTATQLADQQDKVNAALRQAIVSYNGASSLASSDKAGEALLRMAGIYDEKLKDSVKAMEVWKETVRQFSGTVVAEDASWKIARYHEIHGEYKEAIVADKNFLKNYRRSARAESAQFAIAEHFEHLNDWVSSMDAYTNYIKNYPKGGKFAKAKEQINWIKTYRL